VILFPFITEIRSPPSLQGSSLLPFRVATDGFQSFQPYLCSAPLFLFVSRIYFLFADGSVSILFPSHMYFFLDVLIFLFLPPASKNSFPLVSAPWPGPHSLFSVKGQLVCSVLDDIVPEFSFAADLLEAASVLPCFRPGFEFRIRFER